MEATSIVIGVEGAIGICITLAGGFFAVWRASAAAHEKINGKLDEIYTVICELKVTNVAIKTDVEWLKKDKQSPK